MRTSVIGGSLGYHLLRYFGRSDRVPTYCSGAAYEERSKLECLFGTNIWATVAGKVVIDFGCGIGSETIELVRRGARQVIGIDIRENVLRAARSAAEKAGVANRCVFATHTHEKADVVLSIDGFEHYDDPAGVLRTMHRLVHRDGRVHISFGPPWFHPFGGHLFSVFPWAHVVFTEQALLHWRSTFKRDGATRFGEVEGGLNQMTVRRFRRLLEQSPFEVESFEAVPSRKLKALSTPLTREFFTSVVRCRLVPTHVRRRTP